MVTEQCSDLKDDDFVIVLTKVQQSHYRHHQSQGRALPRDTWLQGPRKLFAQGLLSLVYFSCPF